MIYGNINYIEEKACPPPVKRALQYVKEHDCVNMPAGVYEIENQDIFIQIMDKETGSISDRKPEIHRKYADIQILFTGHEKIGFAVDRKEFEVESDMLDKEDILYYKEIHGEQFLDMQPGDYAVFFPGDIHRPACVSGTQETVRKAVIKVGVHLFKEQEGTGRNAGIV